jgi:hypothetical protein
VHQRKLKVMSRKEMQENRKSERLAAQEQRKLVRSAKKLFEEDLEEDLDDIRRKRETEDEPEGFYEYDDYVEWVLAGGNFKIYLCRF